MRRPAGQIAEAAVVGDEIADIDALAVFREFAPGETSAAIDPHQRLGQSEQRVRRLAADIERLSRGLAGQRGAQKRLDRVIDIEQLAPLLAAPYLEALPFKDAAQPDAEKVLPCVLDPHPGPVDIRQPQRTGVEPVRVVKHQVIGLAGHLVDAVDVGRAQRVRLVDRQVARAAVDLARAGMHDRDLRRDRAARFEQLQLRRAVDREVVLGRVHRVEMAGLPGQIEQEILSREQMAQRRRVADIGDVEPHPPAICQSGEIGDVGRVGAALRHHAVEQYQLGAEPGEPPRQRRADQPDPAGDQHARAAEGGKVRVAEGRQVVDAGC